MGAKQSTVSTGDQATAAQYNALVNNMGLVTSGNYTGDNSANRAIPHGLGVVPKIVIITQTDTQARIGQTGDLGGIFYSQAAAMGRSSATVADSTNFYVGNADNYALSMNASGLTYLWTAIG